jgi:hypothetical protein
LVRWLRRRALVRWLRRQPAVRWLRRRAMPSEAFVLPALALCQLALGALALLVPGWCPPSTVVVPILVGSFLLRIRSQLVLLVTAAVELFVMRLDGQSRGMIIGSAALVGGAALLVLARSRARTRLGVRGTRGESMLLDLRERLLAQGRVPRLPDGWHVDKTVRSAGAQSFAGDFIVAATSRGDTCLELGLVDVSGKGVDAGSRALLLAGAFGGLLGSVTSGDFLLSANRYLIRQSWDEGFATAVHVAIDLETGEFEYRSAGHPPIARLTARTGRWELATADGPLLGVIPDVRYPVTTGRLAAGDALLLFTDGLIELPGRDLSLGLDKLLGAAESLVTGGFPDGAVRLVDAVASGVNDDRAVVLVWRD